MVPKGFKFREKSIEKMLAFNQLKDVPKIEKLSEAIDRNVKDALFEDIGFGDRAEAIIPAKM